MMKILKYILFTIIGIVALALIIALFLPKTFRAEGKTVINRSNDEVFEYIKHIRNQENFGTWFKMDENMKKESIGIDGTVGFRYKWESAKVGDGEQVITHIDEGKRIDMYLFFNNDPKPAKSYMTTTAIDSTSTNFIWAIEGEMPYPYNLMSLFYDMNKDFEEGVQNLKAILEK